MKKIVSLILTMLFVISYTGNAFAIDRVDMDAMGDSELNVYEIEGVKYVDLNGEKYRYLSINDFKPIDNPETIQMLEASEYLPVPPVYGYNLADGAYSGKVNLNNGSQWSPLFRRDVPKRYTNFSIDTILTKTVSICYFYYNAYEEKWYGDSVTDWEFNLLIDTRQFQFGTMGDAAQGLRILFLDFENSTKSFDYTLKDVNMPL